MSYPYVKELADHPYPGMMTAMKIETKIMPLMEQDEPIEAKSLHEEFCTDWKTSNEKYLLKRQTVKGTVIWMGADIHHKHSIQLSDSVHGDCYVHCVLISEKEYGDVKVGDSVVMQGNYLECHPEFGVVLKMSEVVKE